MRTLADGTVVRGGFVFGGIRILFLIIFIAFIVAVVSRIVMMLRLRKAMKSGDMDQLFMHGPRGRMLMMRGGFSDDQAAGIIIRSMKKNGASDGDIRSAMTGKYGYSALMTDAMLLTSMGGHANGQ